MNRHSSTGERLLFVALLCALIGIFGCGSGDGDADSGFEANETGGSAGAASSEGSDAGGGAGQPGSAGTAASAGTGGTAGAGAAGGFLPDGFPAALADSQWTVFEVRDEVPAGRRRVTVDSYSFGLWTHVMRPYHGL